MEVCSCRWRQDKEVHIPLWMQSEAWAHVHPHVRTVVKPRGYYVVWTLDCFADILDFNDPV